MNSKEFLFILLNTLEFNYSLTNHQSVVQFRLKHFNIDNNFEYITRYPVLITPLKPLKKEGKDQTYILNVLLKQNTDAKQYAYYE